MRIVERLTVLLFVLVLAAYGGLKIRKAFVLDTESPVIAFDTDVLEISVKDGPAALLNGVTASDDRDGDLTDKVMVSGVTQLLTADTAKVTYIVADGANNMASKVRTVRYTDYTRPRFYLTAPLLFRTGDSITLRGRLFAEDVIDGDLTENIRVASQNISAGVEGVFSVTVQVTNSMGDTESVTLPVLIDSKSVTNRTIVLKKYLVYMSRGGEFDPYEHIAAVNGLTGGLSDVETEGEVDTETPGCYPVRYSYKDGTVYLTVVVE